MSLATLPPVSAQTSGTVGITVSPITDEFSISPGEVKSRVITVINPGEKVITLYPRVLDFSTDNENGQPSFFETSDEGRTYTLSSWVRFDREFIRIAPNEEEKFEAVINAPADAEPGGHYGAVLFSTEKPDLSDEPNTSVGVVGLVGTLLLASVPGEIVEKLEIESFNVPKIIFGSSAKLDLVFKNSGTIHLKPKGDIVIKNWSGNQTAALAVNEGGGNVLPESRRRFSQQWDLSPQNLGLYTLTASIVHGSERLELAATQRTLVIPYWLLVLLALVVVFAGYQIAKKLKHRSARPAAPAKPPPILR